MNKYAILYYRKSFANYNDSALISYQYEILGNDEGYTYPIFENIKILKQWDNDHYQTIERHEKAYNCHVYRFEALDDESAQLIFEVGGYE